jgi:uncharacterized protein (DUF1684 family)
MVKVAVSPAVTDAVVDESVHEATGPPSLHVTEVEGLAAVIVAVVDSVPFTSSHTRYVLEVKLVVDSPVSGMIIVLELESEI